MPRRRHEVTRLEAFSDAVFALSATLLVVSLEVPRSFPELVANLYEFVSFGLSFAALLLIWTVHNAFFRRFGLQDRWTIFWNGCLLFVILFYVYPLKFVAKGLAWTFFGAGGGGSAEYLVRDSGELATLFGLYGAGFAAVFLCVAMMYRHAGRMAGELGLDAEEERQARFYFRQYLIFVGVGALSIALAAFGVGIRIGLPGWIYGLLGPLCAWHGMRSRAKGGRAGSGATPA